MSENRLLSQRNFAGKREANPSSTSSDRLVEKPGDVWYVLNFSPSISPLDPIPYAALLASGNHGTCAVLERSRPCPTQRALKLWPANEPDVNPTQAPAADARHAHRRAVRRHRLGFRGQVRWLPDDRGNPGG